MRNEEVIKKFINGVVARNSTGSLSSVGDRLFSYATCIAEFDKDGKLWKNLTKYSSTTSRHQSLLNSYTNGYIKHNVVFYISIGANHIVPKDKRI